MKHRMIAIVGMLWMSASASAFAQPQASELDQALTLLERLDSAPLAVDYRQEMLQDVMDDLNARLPVPLRADWPALERLSVDPGKRITLRLNAAAASTVLGSLALALGDEFDRPMFEAASGQIVLTTLAATASMRLTGVYDVRDLLADSALIQQLRDEAPPIEPVDDLPAKSSPPHSSSQAAQQVPPEPAPDTPPPGKGAPKFTLPALDADLPVPANPRPLTPGEQLYMLITDHVDPDAWINFGGDRARVSERDGVLIITATPTTHRKFRDALAALRKANPKSITIEAAIIDLPRAAYDRIARQYPLNSAASAAALRGDSASTTLWQAMTIVAAGERAEVESTSADAAVRVMLLPDFDKHDGRLSISVEAATKHGEDQRLLKTKTVLTGDDGAATFELPATRPSQTIRLLVLLPQRH